MYDRDYTLVISTSKDYQDILDIFLDFININFHLNIKTIVISDSLRLKKKYPKNIQFFLKKNNWSERIKNALEQIDSKYILFFFEDFIIKKKIDIIKIDLLYSFIIKNEIDYLKINNAKRKIDNLIRLDQSLSVGEIPNNDLYPLPLQVSFWKKDFFLKTLKFNYNPWEFERNIKKKINLKNFKIFSVYKNQPIIYNERGMIIKGKIVLSELKFLKSINYPLVTKRKIENYFEYLYRENYFTNLLRKIKYSFQK